MSIFQEIYDSEINFRVACFWDGGFDVEVGDEINGWRESYSVEKWEEVAPLLEELVIRTYPESAFAKARDQQ